MTDEPLPTAAQQWSAAVAAWSVPPLPTAEGPAEGADDGYDGERSADRQGVSTRWAREVLPAVGGTVLDVGCGAGDSAVALAPPASELIGVDHVGARLDEFVATATRAGVARRTIHGTWPEVAAITPVADVAICHDIVVGVADIAPFLIALTMRARLAVVVELPVRHPMSAWNEGWSHFWGIDRPTRPVLDDFLAVVHELGLDPEHTVVRRRPPPIADDPDRLCRVARRRLAIPVDRSAELATWLAGHPPAFVSQFATVRWAGEGEVGPSQAIV